MPAGSRRSLMFNLGAFFGNIARTVKAADADAAPERRVVRQDVQEEMRDTPNGRGTLRRTTIEEIEVHPPLPPGSPASPPPQPPPGQ